MCLALLQNTCSDHELLQSIPVRVLIKGLENTTHVSHDNYIITFQKIASACEKQQEALR